MTPRTCLSTAALAIAALTAAQEQPKVTLTMAATKTSNVAAEIKKQTGVSIVCNPTVADIPILVSVTDVPLDQLLQKIAAATGGEIFPQGENGFLISKSDKLRTEQANKERCWVIAAFERAKAKIEKSDLPNRWDRQTMDDLVAKAQAAREQIANRLSTIPRSPGSQITMYDSSMASSTPSSGAARRALDLLPASVLASVMPGDRIVYSTLPNRMQRRMPINVQDIVADFVYNHNLLAQSAPQLKPMEGVNIIGGLSAGERIAGVVETHLVLSRGFRSSTVQIEIKFADQRGIFVGQGTTSVTPEYTPVQPATSGEGKQIELSELSRQMAVIMAQELAEPTTDRMVFRMASLDGAGGAFVSVDSGDNQPKQFPDELLNVFVNPDRTDPCSLYVSECFIQAARAEGKDLVATFPDSVVRDMARVLVKGVITHKAVLASSPAMGLDTTVEGDWMLVTPTWANSARETRFDRTEAARLFRSINGRGFATLEELADYSFFLTIGLPDRTLDMVYLTLINKEVGDQLSQYAMMSLDLLRLYGALPDATKRQAGDEVAEQFRRLSPQAKALAERAYYARATGFSMPAIPGGAAGRASVVMMQQEVTSGGPAMPPANSVLTEPTEALPNGLPAEALIRLQRTVSEGVYASTKGVRGGTLLTAQELGMRMGMLEANISGSATINAYDSYQPAQIVNVNIVVDLGDYGRPTAYFKDGWLVQGMRAVPYAQLPEGFRAQVDLAKQSMVRPPIPPDGSVRLGRGGGG